MACGRVGLARTPREVQAGCRGGREHGTHARAVVVETAMSSELTDPRDPLLSGALRLAGTSDRDARLAGLARDAAGVVPGGTAVVYLLDDRGTLYPAAAHPIDVADLDPLDGTAVIAPEEAAAPPTATDAAALAVGDRREVVALSGGDIPSALLGAIPGSAAVVHVPLVLRRPAEHPDVEGVLSIACPSAPPDGPGLDMLRGIAALAAMAALQARLEHALAERSDWFERLAHTDALTGLANRRTADRVLELELARAARQGTAVCLAVFGVEGQDETTERHGASAADDVLRRVAASLAETVRLVDTVARYGRGEFLVIAPGSTGLAMAERAAAAVRELEPGPGGEPVRVSVGVASFPAHGTSPDELIDAAERALAAAREQGGTVAAAG